MVVYIDLVVLINFIFDASLLLVVDLILKRNVKMKNIAFGALAGELSMITLFINFNRFTNFLFKIALSVIMCVCAFGFKNSKFTFYNTLYLYLVGIILGGFEYYLFNEFQVGGSLGIKYLIVLVLSPLILFVYYKVSKRIKNDYNNRHSVKIVYDGEELVGTGYLDSGNKLVSPISGKRIILVEKEYIVYKKLKLIPVPYTALNHHGLLMCFNPDAVYVDEAKYDNVLIGLSEVKFNIDGVNILLNSRLENL